MGAIDVVRLRCGRLWPAVVAAVVGTVYALLFMLATPSCQTVTDGDPGTPRIALDMTVTGEQAASFARSAPLQNLHVFGFRVPGRVRILELSSGLVLWEGVAVAGQVLFLSDEGNQTFLLNAPLPLAAAGAFGANELVDNGAGILVAPEYGLTFQ